MKIKKAKGVQHSVEGYVCACLMSANSCGTYQCLCACQGAANPYENDYGQAYDTVNSYHQHSSGDSVQNGLEG